MGKHRHRFKLQSYCVDKLTFKCSCGESKERKPTRGERMEIRRSFKAMLKPTKIHHIWHRFVKRFKPDGINWGKKGHDLMCAVERWARKYPSIKLVACDDYCHAGARLVLIPHEKNDEYWGTTVIFLQQFGDPAEFFLYPWHHESLLKEMMQIQKRIKKKGTLEDRESDGPEFNWMPEY